MFWFLPQGFDILIVAVVVSQEEGAQGLATIGTVIISLDDNKDQKNFFFIQEWSYRPSSVPEEPFVARIVALEYFSCKC